MKYTRLGRTDLQVSRLGLGANRFHTLDVDEGKRFLAACLDAGVNLIDTAHAYGDGASETALGRTLNGRSDVVIATKFRLPRSNGKLKLSSSDFIQALNASLKRLRREFVDIYHVHGVGPDEYPHVIDALGEALQNAKQSGKTRYIGITENCQLDPDHLMLNRAIPSGLFDVILVKYSVINPSAEEHTFPLAAKHNVGVMTMVPVQAHSVGYLGRPDVWDAITPEWRTKENPTPRVSSGVTSSASLRVADRVPLHFLVEDGPYRSIAEAACAFAAQDERVGSVVSGMRSIEHLLENLKGVMSGPIPPALRDRLTSFASVDREHLVRQGKVS